MNSRKLGIMHRVMHDNELDDVQTTGSLRLSALKKARGAITNAEMCRILSENLRKILGGGDTLTCQIAHSQFSNNNGQAVDVVVWAVGPLIDQAPWLEPQFWLKRGAADSISDMVRTAIDAIALREMQAGGSEGITEAIENVEKALKQSLIDDVTEDIQEEIDQSPDDDISDEGIIHSLATTMSRQRENAEREAAIYTTAQKVVSDKMGLTAENKKLIYDIEHVHSMFKEVAADHDDSLTKPGCLAIHDLTTCKLQQELASFLIKEGVEFDVPDNSDDEDED